MKAKKGHINREKTIMRERGGERDREKEREMRERKREIGGGGGGRAIQV